MILLLPAAYPVRPHRPMSRIFPPRTLWLFSPAGRRIVCRNFFPPDPFRRERLAGPCFGSACCLTVQTSPPFQSSAIWQRQKAAARCLSRHAQLPAAYLVQAPPGHRNRSPSEGGSWGNPAPLAAARNAAPGAPLRTGGISPHRPGRRGRAAASVSSRARDRAGAPSAALLPTVVALPAVPPPPGRPLSPWEVKSHSRRQRNPLRGSKLKRRATFHPPRGKAPAAAGRPGGGQAEPDSVGSKALLRQLRQAAPSCRRLAPRLPVTGGLGKIRVGVVRGEVSGSGRLAAGRRCEQRAARRR